MGVRAVTGYIAHVLLVGYWLWIASSTAPQLRKGARDRALAIRISLVKTCGVVITALVVGVIHFWATELWHVLATLALAVALAIPLRKNYRAMVAAPRHRLTLEGRARAFERRHRFGQLPWSRARPKGQSRRRSPSPSPGGSADGGHPRPR